MLMLVGLALCSGLLVQPTARRTTALRAAEGTKQPWINTRPEPKTARERVSFKNKIPFTDDMYETIKRAIELLSKRARTDPAPEKLTVDEAEWFKGAVEIILEDAKKFGPPPRPERTAAPAKE